MEKIFRYGNFYYSVIPEQNKVSIYKQLGDKPELIATVEYEGVKQKPTAHSNAAFICARMDKYDELKQQNESLRKDIEGLQEENKRLQNCLKDINAVLLPIDFLDFTKAETKIKNLAEKALNNITDKG